MLITTLIKNSQRFHRMSHKTKITEGISSAAASKEQDQKKNKLEKMNKVVILITVFFLIFTVPASIPLFYVDIFETEQGRLATKIIDCFSFSYYALNFFITYLSNNIFKGEVNRFLGIGNK